MSRAKNQRRSLPCCFPFASPVASGGAREKTVLFSSGPPAVHGKASSKRRQVLLESYKIQVFVQEIPCRTLLAVYTAVHSKQQSTECCLLTSDDVSRSNDQQEYAHKLAPLLLLPVVGVSGVQRASKPRT